MTWKDEPPHAASRLFTALRGQLGGPGDDALEAFDPGTVQRVVGALGFVYRPGGYFDLQVRGLETVPRPPVMLVSNHSGGTLIPDVWGMGVAWYRHFGTSRPLYVLGHELLFTNPAAGQFFARCGVLRASAETAGRVLEAGHDLLVMPGGAADVWRPYRLRYQVNFAGHKGYARAALEAKVPVVPVAHAGAHETFRVLSSGRWLARLLGLHRVARTDVWPIHLSLPWGLAVGPLPHWPLPAKFRYLLGAPIAPGAAEVTLAAIDRLDAHVRGKVQAQLDQLALEASGRAQRSRSSL